jgi:uncharacterized protein (TIGR03067 family)
MTAAMRLVLAGGVWATLALIDARADPQPPAIAVADDRAASAGVWDVVKVEMNGKRLDDEFVAMLKIAYQSDGAWTVLFKGLVVGEGRSQNDPDTNPKTFEMETRGGTKTKPRRYTGIYRIEGDSRELCFVSDGMPRPDDFTAPRKSGRILVTLRRTAVH